MSFDWNNAAEQSIAGALGLVPEVGSLLAALVYIFWPPSKEDIWSEIKDQVEQLVDQKIDQVVYQQVQDDLTGLSAALTDYLNTVKTGDAGNISVQWIATKTVFDTALPHFQSKGYELLLLPLYAQFGNMYFSLLRDGVIFGSKWNWNKQYQQMVASTLTNDVTTFVQYANQTYQTKYQSIANSTGTDYHACQPFRNLNSFSRQMTLSVLDFSGNWQYFDATKYPNPVSIHLTREIYSDPIGTADDSGPINLPSPPTKPITQIIVWAWDRIDAVQLTYPAGGGPNGVAQTARMGDSGGGTDAPPGGGIVNIGAQPITIAAGYSGDILGSFNFTFEDGSSTADFGANLPPGQAFSFSYPGHILSSIHINGVSNFYNSADCAVFGFKLPGALGLSLSSIRTLYITNPKDISLEQLAESSAASLQLSHVKSIAVHESWDAKRQAFWQRITARSTT
jgi:delta endotoxin, N-terminal domain